MRAMREQLLKRTCERREIGQRPCLARLARRCPGRASDCERGRQRLTSASLSERTQSQIARAAKKRAQQQDWYVIVVLEPPEVSIPHAYSREPLPQ
jgi:hypothetical protein